MSGGESGGGWGWGVGGGGGGKKRAFPLRSWLLGGGGGMKLTTLGGRALEVDWALEGGRGAGTNLDITDDG